MNQKDTVEIWCYLHSCVDGQMDISPNNGLANHCRVPAAMVDYSTDPSIPQRILLRIPNYLAAGLGLMRPSENRATPAATVGKISAKAPEQRLGEFSATVDDNGNLNLHHHNPSTGGAGGRGGILESGTIVRSKAEQIRQEAKQVGGL